MKKLTTTLMAVALSFGTAFGAEKPAAEKGKETAGPEADKKFLMMAEETNLAEIKAGEMAKEKGMSNEVKQYGEKLITDHKSNSADLQSLAKSKGVTLPTEPNAKQKAEAESLSKMEGEKFDVAFNEAMATGHKKAIGMFNKAAKSSDPEIKAFAEKTLPTLKDHQKMAMSDKAGAMAKGKGTKADSIEKKSDTETR